ncbi:pyrroline-5-carboxylate reductase [Candidatus Peregrinibacteria bacterium]|nr:pyrroline-5-carboxylate reductase [Candidatus Peregrinibacteria bacterium]
MNLLIIGGGNMGGAIVRALLEDSKRIFSSIFVCDANREKREMFLRLGVKTILELDFAVCATCDVILVAVKPQDFSGVLSVLQNFLGAEKPKLILSIAAGIPISFIRSYLPSVHIIRIMPNTPAMIQQGISAWTAGREVTSHEKKIAQKLLRTLGDEVYIENEGQMDAVTALSGCGPAYVYLFLQSLILGGDKLGLSKEISAKLAMQTVLGATLLAEKSPADLDTLIKNVASKGGTTEAALSHFEKKRVSQNIQEAMKKAFLRGREFGRKFKKT